MCLGGAWNPELDGANCEDIEVLQRTAVRCIQEHVQLDLSKCSSWMRLIDITYRREASEEDDSRNYLESRTVILLPNTTPCVPSQLEWPDIHRQRCLRIAEVCRQRIAGNQSLECP